MNLKNEEDVKTKLCVKKRTSWNQGSSHWRPGDENEGQRLQKKSEERYIFETYAIRDYFWEENKRQ